MRFELHKCCYILIKKKKFDSIWHKFVPSGNVLHYVMLCTTICVVRFSTKLDYPHDFVAKICGMEKSAKP